MALYALYILRNPSSIAMSAARAKPPQKKGLPAGSPCLFGGGGGHRICVAKNQCHLKPASNDSGLLLWDAAGVVRKRRPISTE
jgi:hypothetical protein